MPANVSWISSLSVNVNLLKHIFDSGFGLVCVRSLQSPPLELTEIPGGGESEFTQDKNDLLTQSSGHNLELIVFKTMEMIDDVLLPSPSDTSSTGFM